MYLIKVLSFVWDLRFNVRACACAGWLREGEGGLGDYQPGVYVPLKALFLVATRIVLFLYFLNLKLPASSHLLCLYCSVCFGPVWKPHCWFSHDVAHIQKRKRRYTCFLNKAVQLAFSNIKISTLLNTNENNIFLKENALISNIQSIFN